MIKIHTVNEIVEAYFLNYKTKQDVYFWAWEEVDKAAHDEPDRAWQLIMKLVEKAENKKMLCYIGSGPLEDLLTYHGEAVIDRIELKARHDQQFKFALSCVWENRIPKDIWKRVLKASDRKSVADSP